MKMGVLFIVLAAMAATRASAAKVSPIQKVMEMISDLQAKIIKEGTEVQSVYEEFAEFCEDRSKELGFEIKTSKASIEDLSAVIDEEAANIESLNTKVEEVTEKVSKDEKELKEATAIRNKEKADFDAAEKDLSGVVDTLGKAIGVLEKEMGKSGGASMLQLKSATNIMDALRVMVDGSMITIGDGDKLTALIQNNQVSEDSDSDSDSDMGAPDPAVYKGQAGGIIEAMQGLFEKAEDQLAALRQKEAGNLMNFKMLKQSLDDAIKYATKEIDDAKKEIAESEEKKADAEGELTVVTKDMNADVKTLAELHQDCMTKATDFEDETKSRSEELKALATAKKIIKEATSLEQQQADDEDDDSASDSFVQVGSRRARMATRALAESTNFQAVELVRNLAKEQKSTALAQLASRLSSTLSTADGSKEDVFGKIKGLVVDMIDKLEAEAEADATKKAYCDKENAESAEKKDAKESSVEKLTTAIDGMTSKIAKLGEEVSVLQVELGKLNKAQAEMDKVREEEKTLFEASKAELDKGIKGIKLALKVLTEYYAKEGKAHGSSDGAGSSIISMLEVAESDFTKELAEITSAEESAVAEYEKETQDNELSRTTKEQDVKYKTKESKQLQVALAEAKEDLQGVTEELDAVLEYIAKLKKKCFPLPPESYEERVKRRTAEIEGLRKALTVLDGEAVLIQKSTSHHLRRASVHRHA